MEQLWDKSLEQQAVARAWRMGAGGSVEVETLVARNTVEETMSRLEKRMADPQAVESDSSDVAEKNNEVEGDQRSEYQRTKLQFLLKGLSLITNSIAMSSSREKRKAPALDPMTSAMVKKSRPSVRKVRFAA